MTPRLDEAAEAGDIDEVRALFEEYERSLGIDMCFQGFARELEGLPGAYAAPRGRLWLARVEGRVGGTVALRPRDDAGPGASEMKRLYVRPAQRGHGLGRALAERAVAAARHIGYTRMLLDTLPSMREAIAIYRSLGFRDCAPYCANPIPGALYLELVL